MTYFKQNGFKGACGILHNDSAFIIALDSRMYDKKLCGRQITINAVNGKSQLPMTALSA